MNNEQLLQALTRGAPIPSNVVIEPLNEFACIIKNTSTGGVSCMVLGSGTKFETVLEKLRNYKNDKETNRLHPPLRNVQESTRETPGAVQPPEVGPGEAGRAGEHETEIQDEPC
jgi:hypothetical protein